MSSREDTTLVKAVEATGHKELAVSALWTKVCLTFPVLVALGIGYEVYVVASISGGASVDAHGRSIDRIVQTGTVPVTWQRVLLEYQHDWSRREAYDAVMGLVCEHSGTYNIGANYVYIMMHGAPEHKVQIHVILHVASLLAPLTSPGHLLMQAPRDPQPCRLDIP